MRTKGQKKHVRDAVNKIGTAVDNIKKSTIKIKEIFDSDSEITENDRHEVGKQNDSVLFKTNDIINQCSLINDESLEERPVERIESDHPENAPVTTKLKIVLAFISFVLILAWWLAMVLVLIEERAIFIICIVTGLLLYILLLIAIFSSQHLSKISMKTIDFMKNLLKFDS